MNAFYEHHKNSIRFHYRCFDRILLNAIIQPFQQEERVVGFFNTYRQLYPVTRDVLRDGRKSAMWTIPRTWGLTNHHQPTPSRLANLLVILPMSLKRVPRVS